MRQGKPKASLRCLIVEDDELQIEEFLDLLPALGHSVVGTAATVEDAIKMAEEREVDVAIVDLLLRRRGFGGDVAELLLKRCGIPSVIVSAYPTPEHRDIATSLGVVGFVPKPLDPSALDAFLARVAEQAETNVA